MATSMLMLLVIILAITVAPWLSPADHNAMHKTDLMAGDEGDD